MNTYLQQLVQAAGKPHRLIIGLMSGTSLDGLDVALCRCTGNGPGTQVTLLQFETVPYEASFKKAVKEVFARQQASLQLVCLLHPWIGQEFARIVLQLLHKWEVIPADVDLVASHGQTIYHAPQRQHGHDAYGNATLQIGDGDHIAVHTGIITLSDFRQKHIAAGGEGAPLAAYGDYLVFSKQGEDRVMLNIGGIANFTWLPGSLDADEVFSTDVGPGNTLMDAWTQLHFPGTSYDEGGAIALQGQVDSALLAALLHHGFFSEQLPKTTGPELFGLQYIHEAQMASNTTGLTPYDVMATLSRFSAEAIARSLAPVVQANPGTIIYTSGGGMHNPLLMQHLQELLPGTRFTDTNSLGINPDAKEAVLFAVLANECICGGHAYMGEGRNGIPNVTMGKISLPG